ncbi:MAG: ABC transporter permease [Candidatus Cloacimonetes bacterium]|nr:ABC transporter permease [Candidatus Cloacimonadota bacterium]
MLKNYFKIAFKVMMRNKLFTFISLFGICFTLLILVLVTSALDHTFGPHYPEKKLGRTLSVTMGLISSKESGTSSGPLFSPYFFKKYVKTLKTPQKISLASFHNPIQIYKDKKKIKLGIKYVDSEFWEILDFNFLEGKAFIKNDVNNISNVAVINQKIRDQYFNGEEAVGKYIEADGKNFRVIGVVENVSILRIMPYADIWVPLGHTSEDLNRISIVANQFPGWFAMVLAHNKKDIPKIKSEFQNHLKNIEFPEGKYEWLLTNASTYQEALARQIFRKEDGNIGPFMFVLYLLMVIFMILPAINLVNINVSRILERASEIGIRKSFGASSMTLVGQFMIENIIITLIGGLISFLLASIILAIFNQTGLLPDTHFALNFRIFFTGMMIALFFGLISGVYPAFKMSKLQPAEIIQGGNK